MNAFEYGDIRQQQSESGKPYLQFLNEGTMSLGLYVLEAGSIDRQTPHAEDEVYYVVSGAGSFTCEGQTIAATAGSTIYVAAHAEHRFHDITESLTILVFFAPAES